MNSDPSSSKVLVSGLNNYANLDPELIKYILKTVPTHLHVKMCDNHIVHIIHVLLYY